MQGAYKESPGEGNRHEAPLKHFFFSITFPIWATALEIPCTRVSLYFNVSGVVDLDCIVLQWN
jgi:hypothetical protein